MSEQKSIARLDKFLHLKLIMLLRLKSREEKLFFSIIELQNIFAAALL